jgi:hypothetical protein
MNFDFALAVSASVIMMASINNFFMCLDFKVNKIKVNITLVFLPMQTYVFFS